MTTSPRMPTHAKPHGDYAIPAGTLGYLRTRNKWRMHDLVMREFKKSKLSKATLARRLGKAPEVINRLLGAPGNWTLDTVSDLLFAISGAELRYSVGYPLATEPSVQPPRWLQQTMAPTLISITTGDAVVSGSLLRGGFSANTHAERVHIVFEGAHVD